MKAYTKTVIRSFKSNISRFMIIMAITMLGLSFITGLGNTSPVIRASFAKGLKDDNIADIIVKNKTASGFTNDEITKLKGIKDVSDGYALTSIDTIINEERARFYVLDENPKIGGLKLVSGRLPEAECEIIVEQSSMAITPKEIGSEINYMNLNLKIVGIVQNPMMFFKQGDAYLGGTEEVTNIKDLETLQLAIYSFRSCLPTYMASYLPYTDCYLKIITNHTYFTNEYDSDVSKVLNLIDTEYACLTLNDNLSYAMLDNYCDKINIILLIFPLFFIAVTALVVLSSMSRMIEEERSVIACFKTQGYSNFTISFKYLLFSFLSTFLGSIAGVVIGVLLLPSVIYPAFATVFYLPKQVNYIDLTSGIIVSIVMVLLMVSLAWYLLRKNLKCSCSELLKPKSPKAGKKILLERIGFIWKKLSFKYKSSIRNIIRYKGHLIMTVVSVAGSTALAFAGFALYDISGVMEKYGYEGLKDTLIPISIVVIIFALLLCMLVVYNLTNMNIKERNKEMATLKVLGYYNNEATMYIYREILIMVIMGIIVGIPLGLVLIYYVTNLLEFGSLEDIKWYSYLLTTICVLVFIFLVDILLASKIKKIDMTESLKSID